MCNTILFQLAVKYVSHSASFRLEANILRCKYHVMHNPVPWFYSWNFIASSICVLFSASLPCMTRNLRNYCGLIIVLDSAAPKSTTYPDLTFRIFLLWYSKTMKVHASMLPMLDRHTGIVMGRMIDVILISLRHDWNVPLLDISSNCTGSKTGRVAGTVTNLSNAMCEEYELITL